MADFWSGLGSGVGGSLGALAGRGLGALFGGRNKWQKRAAKDPIGHLTRSAKKAGIHPLYALGASASFSPMAASGDILQDQLADVWSRSGQQMARPSRGGTSAVDQARIKALTAQANRDNAAAAAELSRAKRLTSAARIGGRPDIVGPGQELEPVPVLSHKKSAPHKTSAKMPALQEVTVSAEGDTIVVPSEGTGGEDNPELLFEAAKQNFARGYREVQRRREAAAKKGWKALKRAIRKNRPIPFRDRR